MKILIPGLVQGVQITRIREEAEKRGHAVDGCYGKQLVCEFNDTYVNAYIRDNKTALHEYDLIYLKVTGNNFVDWYQAAYTLNAKYGTKIVNYKYIADDYKLFFTSASDYSKQAAADLAYPKSLIFYDINSVKKVIEEFEFPFIVKVSGKGLDRQGRGVNLVKSKEELKNLIKQYSEEANRFIAREFIPNDGDIRVFTVGYKAIGAMKRTPKVGDFRSNISQGGEGESFDLAARPDVQELAEKASALMRTEIAGVDIMINKNTNKPYILEVNGGPQFEGLETYTKVNAALEIVKYFEAVVDGSVKQ